MSAHGGNRIPLVRGVAYRARKLLATASVYARAVAAGRDLARQSGDVTTYEEALAFGREFRSHGYGIPAHQLRREVVPFLEILTREQPKVMVEIGSAEGGTLFLWSRAVARDALLVSIDHPDGRWGGSSPLARSPLHRRIPRPGQRIVLIRRDSHDPRALERLRSALAGRPVDALFIDGDHTYEGVRQDYETFAPLVRNGGIVALHDINHRDDGEVGVQRFWRELTAGRTVEEFVEPAAGKGIGVLRMP